MDLGDHWHPWETPCLDADAECCAEAGCLEQEPAEPALEALTMYECWCIDDLTCALVEN